MSPTPNPPWSPSSAGVAAIIGGVLALVAGLLLQRSDVAALGVPLLIGALWDWWHRPLRRGRASLRGPEQISEPGRLTAEIVLEPAVGVEAVALKVGAPGHRWTQALVAADPRSIEIAMHTVRTGRREVFRFDYREAGPDHHLLGEARSVDPITITVLPGTRMLRELPLPFRLQGLTGPHGWRRNGDGGDLHDVHAFTPGDRLRRIDWRVTARISAGGYQDPGRAGPPPIRELFVRRTFATADATVMLVLDSRDEIGPNVATWGDATALREDEVSSLDLARQAAASLARHYLDVGDRVGLEDLGRIRRPVPPAGGRQHGHRLVQRLALARPEGEPQPRKRVPRLPSGSLIVVFSTFLDDDAAGFAAVWRHGGHRVLAVDVLPSLVEAELTDRQHTAYRIVRLERQHRMMQLGRTGVEIVPWGGSDSWTEPGVAATAALTALARSRVHR